MVTNESLELFFQEYEDIISNGLEYNYSEKEICDAIYSREFNKYLRKGIHPRLDELSYVVNFVREFRSGGLEVKSVQKKWVWHSEPNSCSVCQERDGRIYNEKPEPAHPNCNCEFEEIDEQMVSKYEERYRENIKQRDDVAYYLSKNAKDFNDCRLNDKGKKEYYDPQSGNYKPLGECATYVRRAIEENTNLKIDQHGSAKNYGKALEKVGFQKIPEGKNYEARKGDVKIYQPHKIPDKNGNVSTDGHMQMFDGKQWISDYNQVTAGALSRNDRTGMYPSQNYKDHEDSQIYRYPKWQEWK